MRFATTDLNIPCYLSDVGFFFSGLPGRLPVGMGFPWLALPYHLQFYFFSIIFQKLK